MKTTFKRAILALTLAFGICLNAGAVYQPSASQAPAESITPSPRYVNISSISAGLGKSGGMLEADCVFRLYTTHQYIVESVVRSTDGTVEQTKSAYGTATGGSAESVPLYFSVPKNKTYKHTATLKVLGSNGNVIEQTSVTSNSYLYG